MNIKTIRVGYLKTNCYILSNENECLIIDPGDEITKIESEIKDRKVIGILITHHHFDHIGCLDILLNKYKCNKIDFNLYESDIKEININDFTFNIIKTPGHKDDSVTFYFKKDKAMFTGDFLFRETIGRCDLEGSSIPDMKESINKIKKYPNDIRIFPGHGNETNLGYEKTNNEYFINNNLF